MSDSQPTPTNPKDRQAPLIATVSGGKDRNFPPRWLTTSFLVAASPLAGASLASPAPTAPHELRCEFAANPLGVDEREPRLSWKLPWPGIGARQTAYQIVAAKDAGFSNVLWDSGKSVSDQSHLVAYAGPPPQARERIYWKIRAWDQNGTQSPYSEPAFFEMGLLDPTDWTAKWITAPASITQESAAVATWERHLSLPQVVNGSGAAWLRERLDLLAPPPYLRKEFESGPTVVSARLFISGLGYYEAWINGQRVGNHILSPAITQYARHALYEVHDVTDLLRQGKNVLGVILGDGWFNEQIVWPAVAVGFVNRYGPPSLIAQLEIRSADGTVRTICSDGSWKVGTGGLLRSQHFLGECYDAKREPEGWTKPAFDDSAWPDAVETAAPIPKLMAQSIEPEREISTLAPVSSKEVQPGVWVFDLGEMTTGYVEIQLDGKQTRPVTVRVSEWLRTPAIPHENAYPDLHYDDLTVAEALTPGMILCKHRSSSVMGYVPGVPGHTPFASFTQTYVPKGDGQPESWKPRFAIQTFRYIEVLGLEAPPAPGTITAIAVHTDTPRIGHFKSSNQTLNLLHEAALNSSVQCNHAMSWDNAAERAQSPYTYAWPAPLVAGQYDFARTYRKALYDLRTFVDDQGKPSECPWTLRAFPMLETRAPVPESATVDLLWQYYLNYGDRRELAQHYEAVKDFLMVYWNEPQKKRWLAALRQPFNELFNNPAFTTPSAELPFNPWGDHTENFIGMALIYPNSANTPNLFVTMAHFYKSFVIAEKIAKELGRNEDAALFRSLREEMVVALREGGLYYPETKSWGGVRQAGGQIFRDLGSPSGNAMALHADMVPETERAAVVANLVTDLEQNYNGHFYGGHEGWFQTAQVLSEGGHVDWALDELTGPEFPQMGFIPGTLGLNTIPEGFFLLHGITYASACQSEFQTIMNWVPETLFGIAPDSSRPGFKHFAVAPLFPSQLDSAEISFGTPYGTAEVGWKKKSDALTIQLTIPPNSTATLELPDNTTGPLRVNGQEPGALVGKRPSTLDLPAGTYSVETALRANLPEAGH